MESLLLVDRRTLPYYIDFAVKTQKDWMSVKKVYLNGTAALVGFDLKRWCRQEGFDLVAVVVLKACCPGLIQGCFEKYGARDLVSGMDPSLRYLPHEVMAGNVDPMNLSVTNSSQSADLYSSLKSCAPVPSCYYEHSVVMRTLL